MSFVYFALGMASGALAFILASLRDEDQLAADVLMLRSDLQHANDDRERMKARIAELEREAYR